MKLHLGALAAGLLVALAGLAGGATTSLALLSSRTTVDATTFTTGTWGTTLYLHNDPTPPTGSTAARTGMTMDATAPTTATLFNYDTDCDSLAGRGVARGTGLAAESTTCRYVSWRTGAYSSAKRLHGTATLTVWARKDANGGNSPIVSAYLRDLDPETSTYVEIAASSQSVTTNASSPWATETFTWTNLTYMIPAGHRLELKLVATSSNRNAELAYDTSAYASTLTLP